MIRKTNRIVSVLMVMILAFNFAACSGTKKLSGDPSDVINKLEKAIQSSKADDILALTMVDKGSSLYKEYKDSINIDLYDDEMAGCYKAVAKNIKIKFSESDTETGSGIAKVKATFNMPDWKPVFGDNSVSSAEDLISKVEKAETIGINLTLRLIDTKDGLKIKNVEDLMEVFEFVGCDIVSATAWGGTEETKPSGSETKETKPKETEPSGSAPTETEPSEPEPSESKKPTTAPQPGSKDDLAKAYADYKKVLEKNADGIAWFEKNVSKDSCGLSDLNGDGIPELFFFTQSSGEKNFIDFRVYSYSPANKATANYLDTTLIDATSKISEFAVVKTPGGDIVTYKGFIDEKNVICYYNSYEYNDYFSSLSYSGYIICGVTDGNTANAVCSVRGFDKYTSNSSIDYNEFLRVEKEILTKSDVLFCAKMLGDDRSTAAGHLKGRNNEGKTYAEILKQLG